VPKLLKIREECLTEILAVSVGAVPWVRAAACEEIPWHRWNYDTINVFLGNQDRPYTLNCFFEDFWRTDNNFASQMVSTLAMDRQRG
jgi:hypothetical protein